MRTPEFNTQAERLLNLVREEAMRAQGGSVAAKAET